MEDYLKHAIELVKAQASVRIMSEEEIAAMISSLVGKLKKLDSCEGSDELAPCSAEIPVTDPKRSIKEKSIVCLECGKIFKVITKKHLIIHGLDAAAYREKWGLKKGTPLTCKELQRARRQKMKDMKLWEKRALAREAAK
ncbi:MucR family transcriptional regulator [Mailhella sp.]|uniref:MucR family transcriptional regulator n=1 Tax=Mailhella sp. TaxID=1981029 RepID=UPI004062C825